ncbi:hypothetical protein L1286_05920 [Pseudoalteromonas sp. SMS1]|uniref:hypothetical protein n=1 Tax=Pseudoalteromonas sp. SMS1 TaxID=2908894 RepID=UPI001F206535|nr:hypothetical protein [Pseudoalteromonas sp. SMS1]MCF2856995.1 hypothetical protein [Pseudoalteromonas sp. SMS1]
MEKDKNSGTKIKNLVSICTFIAFMLVGYHFLCKGFISGAEYIAFATLGLVVSLLVKLADRVESFTIGGNEVKLSQENEKAEENISKLKEIGNALADSIIYQLPSMSESHNHDAYRKGAEFIKIYEITLLLKFPQKNPIPLEKIEKAVRSYLSGTALNVNSEAMYDTNDPIPEPLQLLSKYRTEEQIKKVESSDVFKLYRDKLYPIYVNTKYKV